METNNGKGKTSGLPSREIYNALKDIETNQDVYSNVGFVQACNLLAERGITYRIVSANYLSGMLSHPDDAGLRELIRKKAPPKKPKSTVHSLVIPRVDRLERIVQELCFALGTDCEELLRKSNKDAA